VIATHDPTGVESSDGIEIDLRVPLDRFKLTLRWSTRERFLGIFGRSGAGKTTILESIAGLRRDARGLVRVAGRTWLDTSAGIRLPPERRGVGYVPQDLLLFPHLDVMGNILAGRPRASGRARRDGGVAPDPERVIECLQLDSLRSRRMDSLSGGERQRVALGRALCSAPRLLLLDEPLAALDAPLRRRILPYLMRVREEFGIPAIFVSHDASEMWVLCREVAVIEEGSLLMKGPPGEVFTGERVVPMARLDGFENLLAGRVIEADGDTARVAVTPELVVTVPGEGLRRGMKAWVGVRAEDLILGLSPPERISAQNVIAGRVGEVRHGASRAEVMVEAGGSSTPLVVAVTRAAVDQLGLVPGRQVHLIAKVSSFRILAWI